jgi:hypothetical protein
MCLETLHDKARTLGLGAMYEKHWARGGFRDLFDDQSPDWLATPMAEKMIDLRAFESAGLPVAELIGHYCETLQTQTAGDRALGRLPAAVLAYREAGYSPSLPDNVRRAVDAPTEPPA